MQIAILHFAGPPVIGGVERVIYYHATELAKAGYTVRVIAGRGEPFDPSVSFESIPEVDSRHPDVLTLKVELDQGRVTEAFRGLRNRILDQLRAHLGGVQVLVAHNILGLHKNLPLTAALRVLAEDRTAPRLIAWHHDLSWKAARYLPEMHQGYPWDLLRQPWPRTRHVAVSRARQQDVSDLFGIPESQIAVVPGGVDAASVLGIESQMQQRIEETGLRDREPLLLLPARITRRKNIELAIRVVALLRQEYPRIGLIVTGPPGPHNPENATYYHELKVLRASLALDPGVVFLTEALGEAPSDAMMAALYRLADAMILPSYEEGFGLPVLEAAVARLPIFCADIPALRELGGEEVAYFPPQTTPQAVANLIHPALSTDLALKLRRRVVDCFDWHQVVRRHLLPLLENDD